MQSQKILVDADAIVSFVNKNDSGYKWATEIIELVSGGGYDAVMCGLAYGEALTVISMRVGLNEAIRTAEILEGGFIKLVEVDRRLRLRGLEWFKKQTTKNARFTDCVNMALMEELDIKWVFSRDEHYRKNGFLRLGLDE